jgi:hypothetical protein
MSRLTLDPAIEEELQRRESSGGGRSLTSILADLEALQCWDRLPGLAPGQAIVSFPHMSRPLLVSIDPTPSELRLVD